MTDIFDAARPRLEVRVLGRVRLLVDGSEQSLSASRQRALLARLALSGPGGVRRDALVADLWGDAPPRSATNAVQVAVSALRGVAGPDLIRTLGGGYALATEVLVDSAEFEREVAAAEAAEQRGEDAEASALRVTALGRWSATEALLDLNAPFATPWRTRLDDRRLDAIEAHGALLLRLGRASAAIDVLAGQVASHPYREGLAAGLMLALGGAGRQKEALDLFDAVRRRLADDLGVDPGVQISSARMLVLRGAVGGHSEGQDSRGRRPLRTGLRELPASMIGRSEDLRRIDSMLERADVRLLTLIGSGGVGKSRLAQELVRARPADALFVPLAGASEPGDVLPLITAALEIGEPGTDSNVGLAEAIRAHGRPLLLVLDGVDHVRSAAGALSELLAAVPGLQIVATGRSPLGLAAEHRFEVVPLPSDSGASPSVQLLVERIRAQHPLVLTTKTWEVQLVAIARLCAGLPLALELAAARTGVLGLDELHSRLRLSIAALDDGEHRSNASLEASVLSSLDGLTGVAQRVLDAAAMFRNGFVKEDLVAVAGVSLQIGESSLGELVDRSLVRAMPGAGRHRFFMLDPIRDVLLSRLTAPRRDRIAVAHMRRFAWSWCRHDYSEHYPATTGQLRAIAVEAANLQAAIETARRAEPGQFGWMVARLSRAWDLLGRSAIRDEWRAELLDDPALPPRLRFDLLIDRPWPSDDALADAAMALDGFADPLRRHALIVLRFNRAVLRRNLGEARTLRGELAQAPSVSTGALETILGQADAMLAMLDGDHSRALALLRASRQAAIGRGSDLVARAMLRAIGEIHLLAGDPDAAIAAASAIVESSAGEDRWLHAAALSTLGTGLLLSGEVRAAGKALDDAIVMIPTVDWTVDVDDALLRWSAARAAIDAYDPVAGRVSAAWLATKRSLGLPPWSVEEALRTRYLAHAPETDVQVEALLRRGGAEAATRWALTLAQVTIGPSGGGADGRDAG